VYRARDLKLKREVAIKILPEEFARDAERVSRFQREAEVLASLSHPNIAGIHDLAEASGSRYLVLELVEGETLADRIARGPLPVEEALNIAIQVCEALEAAHERGIIHRDLKPANAKITPDGNVKVLDFGLAKAIENLPANPTLSNSPTLLSGTVGGMIIGTAAYMSPEQAIGKPVDRRSDVWSFGAVLYEMLTGTAAFTGASAPEILAAVVKLEPDWENVPASTPAAVRKLLRRCLTKDRTQRLQAMGEARIALENPAAEEFVAAPSKGLRHGWLGWGLAAAFLVIGAVVSFIHFREESPRLTKLSIPPPENGYFRQFPSFAVSPDGRRVAFETVLDGKLELWLRDLDNTVPRVLATIGGYEAGIPFWAPDSHRLGFFDGTKLKTIDVRGGATVIVTDDGGGTPGSGSWNQDDVIIFARLGGPVFRVRVSGGVPEQITTRDKGEGPHWAPWFLPDGHHFLYRAGAAGYGSPENIVYVGDLASKTRKRLGSFGLGAIYVNPGYLLFVRQQILLAQPFNTSRLETTGDPVAVAEQVDTYTGGGGVLGHYSASQNGVLVYTTSASSDDVQLVWYDRMRNKLGTVGPPGEYRQFSLSPDDARVVFTRRGQERGEFDIWTRDLARGPETRLTTSGNNTSPVWSGDGMHIYFRRNREGGVKLYRKNANGTGPEEVLEPGGKMPANASPANASRDGRYLLTQTPATAKTGIDIWVLPLFGDGKPFPYLETEFAKVNPRLARDGGWLSYQSNESTSEEVYVESFPKKGEKWRISIGGGASPVWSRDGRELYYSSPDNSIMAVEIKPSVSGSARFGVPRKLFEARTSGNGGSRFDVSSDGRFLLAVPAGQPEESVPITVVLNWPEMLKKK
jgi:serine/threonine protein kinase